MKGWQISQTVAVTHKWLINQSTLREGRRALVSGVEKGAVLSHEIC